MQLTPYALPAIVALLAKAGMYFYARYSKIHNLQTRLYLLFLFSLSIQNLAEITFFTAKAEGLPAPSGGRLYFGASIPAIAFLLHLALAMATNWRSIHGRRPTIGVMLLYAPALVLEVLLWATPSLVAGFQPLNYTYTKIPGPLYFLFELYALSYLLFAAALLLYGARTQVVTFRRLQNKLLSIGLFPWVALVLTVISLQHFGFRGFNTTATLPLAITFFLAVTAYATHQYRLFDIDFFIPWSKVRKRKTAFYDRIQAMIAEIADLTSVKKVVESLSGTLKCPVVLIGGPQPLTAMAGEALGIARFPLEKLKKIDRIVVANEIAEITPELHALMKRHKAAAIVPFHPHSAAAASWMLLGESFSEQVYTPLDFKVVEKLFDRLADHFLDKQLLMRSQLAEARNEMRALHQRLALAWGQLVEARKQLETMEQENSVLRERNAQLLNRDLAAIQSEVLDRASTEKKTLDKYVMEFEAQLIVKTLKHCGGHQSRAAELLGMRPNTLHYKIVRYGLTDESKTGDSSRTHFEAPKLTD